MALNAFQIGPDRIGKHQRLGNLCKVGGLEFVAVFAIEVPTLTQRLIADHENIKAFAQLAIERLHAIVFANLDIAGQLGLLEQEVFAVATAYGNTQV